MSSSIVLAGIRIYPLKGAGGMELEEGVVDDFGIRGDRRWMLVEPDGGFISQRIHPRLALIRVEAVEGEEAGPGRFQLRAPGMEAFVLPQGGPEDPLMDIRLHQDRLQGRLPRGGGEWFSNFLGVPCHLVFIPPGVLRPVDPRFAPGHRTGFADGYPVLLASEASLAELNRHLPEPMGMNRFRPNLIVRGGAAWEEDEWRSLHVGEARLSLVKPCARCTVTTVDQETGVKGVEPLATMARVRGWEGKTWFGQNGVFHKPGRFRVGSVVHIVERGDPRPPIPHLPSLAGGQEEETNPPSSR